jgi:hypothetical protein
MKRTLCGVIIAGLVAGAPLAVVDAHPGAGSHRRAAPRTAVATLHKTLNSLNRKYVAVAKRTLTCAASRKARAQARRRRASALRRVKRARTSSLKIRVRIMSSAIRRVARSTRSCRGGLAGAPSVATGPTSASAPAAGTSPLGTAAPAPSAGSQPAGSGGSPAPPGMAAINLMQALGETPLALIGDPGASPLPEIFRLEDLESLASPACTRPDTSCVAMDASALASGLEQAVRTSEAQAPALSAALEPLLGQVESGLRSGRLDQLLRLQRVSGTMARFVPRGALAQLAALLPASALPPVTVGHCWSRK